jgi:hypothetical protein
VRRSRGDSDWWVKTAFALSASAIAVAVFSAWEAWIAWRYGESHFWRHLRADNHDLVQQVAFWLVPLFVLLGGTNSGLLLLALAAWRRLWLIAVAAFGIAVICFVTPSFQMAWTIDWPFFGSGSSGEVTWCADELIFAVLGVLLVSGLSVAACRLLLVCHVDRQLSWFLVAWLALEFIGYFVLTPFAAVRRIMGIVVVSTLLVGRFVSSNFHTGNRWAIWLATGAGGFLGLFFFAVDYMDAEAWKAAAQGSVGFVKRRDAQAHVWYVGHWGFQFYAEKAGMRPLVTGESVLHVGDWLVVPDNRLNQQSLYIDKKSLNRMGQLVFDDSLPFRTVQGFYGTATGVPILGRRAPRVTAAIYRVVKNFMPHSKPPLIA